MPISHKSPNSSLNKSRPRPGANRPGPKGGPALPTPAHPYTGKPLNVMQTGWYAGQANVMGKKPSSAPLLCDVTALPAGATVLLIRRYGLGDVLMMTPLVRAMAARGLIVDVQTEPQYRPLLAGNPHIRNVALIGTPYQDWDYDAVVSMDAAADPPNAAQPHRTTYYGACLGLTLTTAEDRRLDYYAGTGEEAEAATIGIAEGKLPRPWVALAWQSNSPSRNWSRRTLVRAVHEIARQGASVLVLNNRESVGVPTDVPNVLDLSASIGDLRELAAVLAACDGVVTPDTGVFHLTAAVDPDKPLLAYFGPFAVGDRQSGAETALTQVNEKAAASCPYMPCRGYDCPFPDVEGESPCLAPDWFLLRAWVEGLPHAPVASPVDPDGEIPAPKRARKVKPSADG